MLITFKSIAAPEIIMLKDLAQYLLGIIGKQLGERGVITYQELPKAMQQLEEAIEAEKKADAEQQGRANLSADSFSEDKKEQPISLAQRAFPLLDMMHSAYRHEGDILWGV